MLRDFTKEPFDIIIQGGQSNSEGCGLGDVAAPFQPDWAAQTDVLYLNADFTISVAAERVIGNSPAGDFSLSFAKKYIAEHRLAESRKLLIIRAAVGGTGFSDGRWGEGNDLDSRMMDMIDTVAALNPENRFVCFLWHQGETDAIAGADREEHKKNLSSLINRVRERVGNKSLPFITGDFVPSWRNKAQNAPEISAAIREVCADVGCAAFVSSEGLLSNQEAGAAEDDIHFSRQSLYELGERMAEAYTRLAGQNR